MADRYVDTVIGASATYDPVARSATGGSDDSYATLAAAYSASANGDTIYLRSGTDTATARLLVTKTNLTIKPYQTEHFIWIQDTPTEHGWQFNGAGSGIDLGDGFITIKGTPDTASYYALAGLLASKLVTANKGRLEIFWDATSAYPLSALGAVEIEMDNIVINSHYKFSGGTSGHSLILNNPILKDTGLSKLNVAATITLNAPIIIGNKDSTEIVDIDSNAVDVILNSPLVIGHNLVFSTVTQFRATTGTITVNGGVSHLNIQNAGLSNAGAVTLTDVDDDAFVKFEKNDDTKFYVSLCFTDSAHAANGDTTNYIAAAAASGKKLTLFTDDADNLGSTAITNINSWLAAGHELASNGISGSDSWSVTQPFKIKYTGTLTNPKLVIAENGTLWTFEDDTGVLATFNCAWGETNQALGLYEAINNIAGDSVLYQLEQLDSISGVTSIVVTSNGSWVGFDDASAAMMEDGTYDLVSGVDFTTITINTARRIDHEFSVSRSELLSEFGVTVKSMFVHGAIPSDVTGMEAYASANGWGAVMGGTASLEIDSDTSPTTYQVGLNAAQTDTAFGATEASIRSGVRRLASWGFVKGAYIPIVFPQFGVGTPWTEAKLAFLIDELINVGATIVTVEEAVVLTQSNVVSSDDNYVLSADSGAIGLGKKWWTGANPQGLNGAPFSDFDTDPGPNQSTHGPFHPVNL